MAAGCDLCGRRGGFGHNVSHSNRHTGRRFQLNLHSRRLTINGERVRLRVCTRCLRTLTKAAEA
jgi:large subunit ribosomal protein L28